MCAPRARTGIRKRGQHAQSRSLPHATDNHTVFFIYEVRAGRMCMFINATRGGNGIGSCSTFFHLSIKLLDPCVFGQTWLIVFFGTLGDVCSMDDTIVTAFIGMLQPGTSMFTSPLAFHEVARLNLAPMYYRKCIAIPQYCEDGSVWDAKAQCVLIPRCAYQGRIYLDLTYCLPVLASNVNLRHTGTRLRGTLPSPSSLTNWNLT
jgi:hypothetical protein